MFPVISQIDTLRAGFLKSAFGVTFFETSSFETSDSGSSKLNVTNPRMLPFVTVSHIMETSFNEFRERDLIEKFPDVLLSRSHIGISHNTI